MKKINLLGDSLVELRSKTSVFSKLNTLQKPLLLLVFLTTFTILSTRAYFTSQDVSPENVFTSGSLSVAISQGDVLAIENWHPGMKQDLEFEVTNTGTMPIYMKGYFGGQWGNIELDPLLFEITALERKVADTWIQVVSEGLHVGEEFFLSSDGTENSLLSLEPGEVVTFRARTKLSETTGDEYQNEVFSVSLHVAAKQMVDSASWPSEY
jgi:predicted ribosomally synthesized peptide with SipW-like signal peptide